MNSTLPISASAIGSVCSVERDVVMAVLKEIFVKFVSLTNH